MKQNLSGFIYAVLLAFGSWGAGAQKLAGPSEAWGYSDLRGDRLRLQIRQSEGLPSDIVYDILEDAEGLLWLSSNEGLHRYDGLNFKRYLPDQAGALPGGNLAQDSLGRIWYQNFDGYCFYWEAGELKRLASHQPAGFQNFSLSPTDIYVLEEKQVVLIDLVNLQRRDSFAIELSRFNAAQYWQGAYYYIAEGQVYRWQTGAPPQLFRSLPGENWVYKMQKQRDRLLIYEKFNRADSIYFLRNAAKWERRAKPREPRQINSLHYQGDSLWLCSMEGLYLYQNAALVYHYPDFLPSQTFHDRQGNLWVSSLDQGLMAFPRSNSLYFPFGETSATRMVASPEPRAFLLSSRRGIAYFYPEQEQLITPQEMPLSAGLFLHYDSLRGSLFQSQKEALFWPQWPLSEAQKIPYYFRHLLRLDAKYYLFGTSQVLGLMKDPLAADKLESAWDSLFARNQQAELPDYAIIKEGLRVRSLAASPDLKSLYVASNHGCYRLESNGSYRAVSQDAEVLNAAELISFKKQILARDFYGKVQRLEGLSATELPLPSAAAGVKRLFNSGRYLIILSENKLWAVSDLANRDAYWTYPLRPHKTQVLQALDYGNQVMLLLNHGLLLIDPQQAASRAGGHFVLNELRSAERQFDKEGAIKLKYNENLLEVNFAYYALFPEALFYQINGSGPRFPLENTRQLVLNALKSGDYQIDFWEASQPEPLARFHFSIARPFWLQYWFIGFMLSLVALIVYALFRRQLKRLEYRNKLVTDKLLLERELDKSTLSSIKAQMNPHFIFNALNTIQSFVYSDQKERAIRYLNKFSKLTRNILEMSERERVSLAEEIEALEIYLQLEKMRFPDSFDYAIQRESQEHERVQIPAMIIQPYVENAIKHGLTHRKGERRLWLRFSTEEKHLLVEVEDNGIGRKRAGEIQRKQHSQHRSFSSQANLTRLDILNKRQGHKVSVRYIDKTNEMGQATGTLVQLRLPLKSLI